MPGKSAESESVLYRAVTSPFQSSGHTHNDGESKDQKIEDGAGIEPAT